jgi:hypothetical protein
MEIQLVFFPGCPHVGAARQALAEALHEVGTDVSVVELDVTDPRTSPALRDWGSPTILVDGVDVVAGTASGSCCRLYPGSERVGAPPVRAIVAALRRPSR